MIDVMAIRGAGDVRGDDIVDTLFTSESVAIQRGRNEIDKGSSISKERITCTYRAGVFVGQTIKVLDSLQGAAWFGKVTDVSISVDGNRVLLDLDVDRV